MQIVNLKQIVLQRKCQEGESAYNSRPRLMQLAIEERRRRRRCQCQATVCKTS